MAEIGDRTAFERMVLPHVDAGYNVARHLLREEAAARDAVQESLLRAWRYFDKLRGTDALPWFLQIVRNTTFTMLQKQRDFEPLVEEMNLMDDSAADPAAEMIERVDGELLRRAVDALPAIYREVIVLRELEGLSYKEIAHVTGAELGTVMSRLTRARKQLLAAMTVRAGKESQHDL